MILRPDFSFLKKKKTKDNNNLKPLEWFKTDEEFKSLYKAEPEKIDRIVKDLAENGYDMSQAIIVTEDGSTVDGNSRIEAVKKYNQLYPDKPITELPYVVKKFDSKEDALLYEIHLNTDRRNIKDQDLLTSFITLNEHKEKLKREGKGTEEYSNEKLAQTLNVSERQISKLRYIVNNGNNELIDLIIKGECSINNAEAEIKNMLNPKKEEMETSKVQQGCNKTTSKTETEVEEVVKTKKETATTPKIKIKDFKLGVEYAISEIIKGKSSISIWENVSSISTISFTDEQLKEIEDNLNKIM